jgi:hypothetical protein
MDALHPPLQVLRKPPRAWRTRSKEGIPSRSRNRFRSAYNYPNERQRNDASSGRATIVHPSRVDQSNMGLWQTMEQEKNSSKLASSRYTLLATRQLGSTRSWNLPTFRKAPSIITSRARMPSPRRSWNTITFASRNVGNRFSEILRFLHSTMPSGLLLNRRPPTRDCFIQWIAFLLPILAVSRIRMDGRTVDLRNGRKVLTSCGVVGDNLLPPVSVQTRWAP